MGTESCKSVRQKANLGYSYLKEMALRSESMIKWRSEKSFGKIRFILFQNLSDLIISRINWFIRVLKELLYHIGKILKYINKMYFVT